MTLDIGTTKILFVAALTLLGLSACSTQQNKSSEPSLTTLMGEHTGQDGRACLRTSRITGYSTTNFGKLITINTRHKYYVAAPLYRCHDIGISAKAVFDGRSIEFCGGGGSSIVTGQERCPIKKLYEFDDRASAHAAIQAITDKRKQLVAGDKGKEISAEDSPSP